MWKYEKKRILNLAVNFPEKVLCSGMWNFAHFRTSSVENPVPVLCFLQTPVPVPFTHPTFRKNPSTFRTRTSFSKKDPFPFRTRTQISKSTRLRYVPVSVHGYGYGTCTDSVPVLRTLCSTRLLMSVKKYLSYRGKTCM